MQLLKRFYDLLIKFVSVKGVLVAGTMALVFGAGLEPIYGFAALAIFVGARELTKFNEVKLQSEMIKKDK